MKPDAAALFQACDSGETPREAGKRLGIHPNRVVSLCEKWSDRGWYEYGVCVDLGWLTALGKAKAADERA